MKMLVGCVGYGNFRNGTDCKLELAIDDQHSWTISIDRSTPFRVGRSMYHDMFNMSLMIDRL